MKPSTMLAISTSRDSSPDTATVRTITPPRNASAVLITVETTSARVTFDNSDPSAANAPSHVIPTAQVPVFIPIGAGSVIKWISTAAAASVLQATFLQ